MEQKLVELANYLCSMKKRDISAERAFEMALQIADEYPYELRPQEALCETYCIIGHIYKEPEEKNDALEKAYEIYEEIETISENKNLYTLAQYMLLDRCIIRENTLSREALLQELLKIDRDYRPYASVLIIKIYICDLDRYRESFYQELELLNYNLEHNVKKFDNSQSIDAFRFLEEQVYKDIIPDENLQKNAEKKQIERIQYLDMNRSILNVWDIDLMNYVDFVVKLLEKEYKQL